MGRSEQHMLFSLSRDSAAVREDISLLQSWGSTISQPVWLMKRSQLDMPSSWKQTHLECPDLSRSSAVPVNLRTKPERALTSLSHTALKPEAAAVGRGRRNFAWAVQPVMTVVHVVQGTGHPLAIASPVSLTMIRVCVWL